ncbi:MAG TPA: sulfotransferase [Solirubrobacterales bacterium]
MARWPDFILVGAPKCATGTIYELLRRGPGVFGAPKDLYFFGSDLATTQPRLSSAEYHAQFEAAPAGARLADSSVGYLCSERAAGEIRAAVPEARIVIALRNPLDAIPSLHRHCLYYGLEEIEDLGEALAAEADRAGGRRMPRRCAHPWMLLYTHVYRYAEQVRRYFDAFGRSSCHVVVYDDFRADPEATMDALRSFLELPAPAPEEATGGPDPSELRVNRARRARSRRLSALLTDPPPLARRLVRRLTPQPLRRRVAEGVLAANTAGDAPPPVDPAVRAGLATTFAAEVESVSRLLGRDLGDWLTTPREAAGTAR